MKHEERDKFIEEQFEKMMQITRSKGLDANANFKEVGETMGLDPKTVLWVYATKHFQSITSFIKNGHVESNEPIEERVHDLVLYSLILLSLIEDERPDKIPF